MANARHKAGLENITWVPRQHPRFFIANLFAIFGAMAGIDIQQVPDHAERFTQLLRSHKLKVTQPRLGVLQIIAQKDTAISQPELERMLGKSVDRVTLYRVLSVLEEKGILHKIFDLQGTATYALCSPACDEHEHHDQHVHFICAACNSIFCLDEINLPPVHLPAGYKLHHVGINAVGYCAKCAPKNQAEPA